MTQQQHVGPYGFMLKKSLMPSGLTGLLLLFFSATDLSLVQVRCTFSGPDSASSAGDWELLEKVVAFLSWMSWTCGRAEVWWAGAVAAGDPIPTVASRTQHAVPHLFLGLLLAVAHLLLGDVQAQARVGWVLAPDGAAGLIRDALDLCGMGSAHSGAAWGHAARPAVGLFLTSRSRSFLVRCICLRICERCSITSVFS